LSRKNFQSLVTASRISRDGMGEVKSRKLAHYGARIHTAHESLLERLDSGLVARSQG
jgi:hypothetical protein